MYLPGRVHAQSVQWRAHARPWRADARGRDMRWQQGGSKPIGYGKVVPLTVGFEDGKVGARRGCGRGEVTRAGSRIACGSTGRRRRHGHPRARGGRRRGWRSGVAASDPAAPPTCGRRRRRRRCWCCSWLQTGRRRAEGAGPRRTTAEVGGTERRGGFLLLLAESRELCFASCMVCRREKGQRDGDWSCSC